MGKSLRGERPLIFVRTAPWSSRIWEKCLMLQLNNIEVYYGKIQALKDVSLTVNSGELVALIGSNGAGKSTTLRTISGLLQPRQGSITYNDTHIDKVSPHQIVLLGVAHCPEGRRIF